ncbi:MAG TPA: AAA family ATPase [Planctomycetota bacterium]|nr:AAA family ATPase [Planctomycetota bacterium]
MSTVPNRVRKSVGRIRQLAADLKRSFEGNERLIEVMAACAVVHEPLLIIGEPGSGKTRMAYRFVELIGIRRGESNGFFEKCFHPYISLEAVFGPLSFSRLTGTPSEYVRLVEGYLPSARVAFLDDIFSASPDFLLTLLSIVEDRVYQNGRELYRSPLAVVIAACNDLPREYRLRALANRLPIRAVSEEISGPEMRARMLVKSNRLWLERSAGNGRESSCTFQDLTTCWEACRLEVPDDFDQTAFGKAYVNCLDSVARHPGPIAEPNARTQQKLLEVMRALALLRREDPEPTEAEIRLVEHIFTTPDARQELTDELDQQGIPEWEYLPSGCTAPVA